MRIAYFDCFSGISGDMAVAALLHAGASLTKVREGLATLDGLPTTLRYETHEVVRSAIAALKFEVLDEEGNRVDRLPAAKADHHHHHHGEDHHHAHVHGEAHDHHHHGDHHHHHHDDHHHGDHTHTHHHHHTTFRSISEMIERSQLPLRVKERAVNIFRAIAIGEARVHKMSVEDVHFHEVGAFDSIADIVAVAICLEDLGIDQVLTSPIPLGSGGMIRTQHGTMPLPAPATLEILKDYPVTMTALPFELTTPTGAGVVRALSSGTLQGKEFQVYGTGFGAGTRELPDRPNLLRVVIGEIAESKSEGEQRINRTETDRVMLVETNVDDMNPQGWPHVIERLLEAGALDVWLTPILMKKGRPAHTLSVLVEEATLDAITTIIFSETSTIGVRMSSVERRKLRREEGVIDTVFGSIRVKYVEGSDGVVARPEADEIGRIAQERNLPFKRVAEILSSDKTEGRK
ncbi:MAG: nickel pincer cofactor biosynthesis protein LarC [Candidatus Kapaibacterium sp.]